MSVSSSALSISTERPTVVGTPVQKPPTAEEIELSMYIYYSIRGTVIALDRSHRT